MHFLVFSMSQADNGRLSGCDFARVMDSIKAVYRETMTAGVQFGPATGDKIRIERRFA